MSPDLPSGIWLCLHHWREWGRAVHEASLQRGRGPLADSAQLPAEERPQPLVPRPGCQFYNREYQRTGGGTKPARRRRPIHWRSSVYPRSFWWEVSLWSWSLHRYLLNLLFNNLTITRDAVFLQLFDFFLVTGSGRYIPGSGPSPIASSGVADPFTGELLPEECLI